MWNLISPSMSSLFSVYSFRYIQQDIASGVNSSSAISPLLLPDTILTVASGVTSSMLARRRVVDTFLIGRHNESFPLLGAGVFPAAKARSSSSKDQRPTWRVTRRFLRHAWLRSTDVISPALCYHYRRHHHAVAVSHCSCSSYRPRLGCSVCSSLDLLFHEKLR